MVNVSRKICTSCRLEKDFKEFHKSPTNLSGLASHCKVCRNAKAREVNKIPEVKANKSTYGRKYRTEERNKQRYAEYRANPINKARKNKREKNRRQQDPLYKMTHNLRTLINISLSSKGYSKSSRTYKLLGADYNTVYQHLVDSAIRNYGYYDQSIVYHIDHIVPCSAATNQDELETLQFYYNLQLLTSEDNLRKSSKLDWSLV